MSNDAENLVAEIQALLAEGRKIEAIKRYREATGAGLAKAKDMVEALGRAGSLAAREPLDSALENEIVSLLEGGKKIGAIKLYRERTGVGLKEAKDAVEAIAAQRGIVVPSGSGCLGAVLLLMVFVPMAAIVFGGEQADRERHGDYVQGTIIDAPHEDGIFTVQPQGTKAPCAAMKIATDARTVVSIAQEKIKVSDLKAGMWVRAEMADGIARKIVAGHLWLEEGDKLVLFKGLPPEFFTHPAGFDVNNEPTKFGPLRMMYRLTGNGSYLRWGRKALPKEGMVVCWPTSLKARFSFGQPVKPDEHGMIHLPADVSELRIWFVDSVVPKKDKAMHRQTARPPFILGADISWVQEQEDEGVHFTDHGKQKDVVAILKDHGFNWIRLRVFHDPKAAKGYSKKGYCDLDHTLAMAKRTKAAGLRFLLDFHYSDTWADPGHQVKPAAWVDLHGADLEKAVHDHTLDVVAALKRQGTPPDMVQIGNEISNGFLWPDGNVWKSRKWDVFCGLIKAGIAGAKEADPSVKVVLHLAWGGQNAQSRSFLDRALTQGVEFDIIGQSYYPKWHGTLDDLRANVTDLAGRYKQDIIVVEYSIPNVRQINDIVHGLPGGKGIGTFIWEPTKWEGPALFDAKGNSKPEIDVYPELAKEYRNQ
jgi:arabinogalactan endo-1,4-beta-galactosidase/ribosomal protein L7/L12